jgi:F-type H+-transporting ATPase subunit gamma
MANLKEIRTRINSVSTTRQITSAMKMVSAAKLRKGQDSIIQMRPYAHKLQQILTSLARHVESEEVATYRNERELNKILLVAITSNKGLCGSFNANIGKQIIAEIGKDYQELFDEGKVDILAIGKKGAELLNAKGYIVTDTKHELFDDLNFESAEQLAVDIVTKYLSGKYDLVKLYYNHFKNVATQIVTIEQYLPVPQPTTDKYEKENIDYILEPSKEEIVEELIPKSLKVQFYKALLESNASEHGARMTAMHKATDNATEMIRDLQLEYNKARQASITGEILEIVGGAEALKG